MSILRRWVTAGVALAAGSGVGFAADAQPPQIQVEHAAARLVIIPEPRTNVSVTIAQGPSRLPSLTVRQDGGRVIVEGGLERPFGVGPGAVNCRGDLGGALWVSVAGIGRTAYRDLPVITAHVPLDTRVAAEGAVYGQVGPARSLQVANTGCGDWTLAPVQGRATLVMTGSGDVTGGDVGTLQAHLSGSGDLHLQRVSDGADIAVAGSGDVHAEAIQGVLHAAVHGSGDLVVERVDGPVQAGLAGSGDMRLKSGRAPSLEVQTSGSAEFTFGGDAGRVQVASSGSGEVHIAHASGPVSQASSGSGEIEIGR